MRSDHSAPSPESIARAPWPLTGRERETARLDALVDALMHEGEGGSLLHEGHGRALVLRGRPGTGRTALLNGCAERARAAGAQVLTATGVRSESSLPLAALHQTLCGVRDRLDDLPAEPAALLGAVLHAGQTTVAEPFLLSTAVLTLLESVARDKPVLLALDDSHWFDEESRRVFGFLARRLQGAPLALVATADGHTGPFFQDEGIPEYSIGSLPEPDAVALLATRHPTAAPGTLRRLLAEAGGNPLGLTELPTLLSDAQIEGRQPLPSPLPLSSRLERTFQTQVRELPAEVRELLLLAALEQSGSARTIWAAYEHGWAGAREALVAAENAGVLRFSGEDGVMTFTEPLLRTAAVAEAPADRRRAAHLALAAALDHDPEQQVRHLAAAGVGLDPAVADALAASAETAAERGLESVALRARSRAADLSGHGERRAELLALAAHSSGRGGQLGRAESLLARAAEESSQETSALALARALLLAERDDDGKAAIELLLRAFDACGDPARGSGTGDNGHDALLTRMFSLALVAGGGEQWHAVTSRLSTGPAWARLMRDASLPLVGEDQKASARLDAAVRELPQRPGNDAVLRLAWAALSIGELGPALQGRLRQVITAARAGDAVTDCADALGLLGFDLLLHGEWAYAEEAVEEMAAIADAHGLRLTARRAKAQLALIAAARGDSTAAREATRSLAEDGAAPGLVSVMIHQANAWAALTDEAYEEAYTHALRASAASADCTALSPVHSLLLLDLVESAALTGRGHEARMHLAAAQAAGFHHKSERRRFLLAAAQAVLASGDKAEALFAEALELPGSRPGSLEYDRLRSAFLRRRTTHDATGPTPLAAAPRPRLSVTGRLPEEHSRTGEPQLGPVPLAAAKAMPVQMPVPGNPADLTPQELQVARLAASGLSNKDIGVRLFLSPRTVSTHLYNLFPKLHIHSRAALHERLLQLGYEERSPRASEAL
ncbi:LuxR C-terminal-related transcriptional regulator [Streptomyces sp. NPDC048297]|uniref:helix-turn-helix transcriptional regulator n=1 Tax=Streptomyces sp. NPDC048297 TaxID=3365531 RepID=UPI003712F192